MPWAPIGVQHFTTRRLICPSKRLHSLRITIFQIDSVFVMPFYGDDGSGGEGTLAPEYPDMQSRHVLSRSAANAKPFPLVLILSVYNPATFRRRGVCGFPEDD